MVWQIEISAATKHARKTIPRVYIGDGRGREFSGRVRVSFRDLRYRFPNLFPGVGKMVFLFGRLVRQRRKVGLPERGHYRYADGW